MASFATVAVLGVADAGAQNPPVNQPGVTATQIRVGGDVIVGLHGAFAVMVALANHQVTGRGAHIDLSSIEAQSCLVGDSLLEYIVTGHVPRRQGNDETVGAPATYGIALATHMARRTLQCADAKRYRQALERSEAWLSRASVKRVLDAAAVLLALEGSDSPAAIAQRKRCLEPIHEGESKDGRRPLEIGWGIRPSTRPFGPRSG